MKWTNIPGRPPGVSGGFVGISTRPAADSGRSGQVELNPKRSRRHPFRRHDPGAVARSAYTSQRPGSGRDRTRDFPRDPRDCPKSMTGRVLEPVASNDPGDLGARRSEGGVRGEGEGRPGSPGRTPPAESLVSWPLTPPPEGARRSLVASPPGWRRRARMRRGGPAHRALRGSGAPRPSPDPGWESPWL